MNIIARTQKALAGIWGTHNHRGSRKGKKVAIFSPCSTGIAENAKQGFMAKVEQESLVPVSFYSFNTDQPGSIINKLDLVRRNNYDLIFTIGGGCTKATVEYLRKNECSTAILSGMVDPSHKVLQQHISNFTGITGQSIPQELISFQRFFSIKPKTHHALYVLDYLSKDDQVLKNEYGQIAHKNRKKFSTYNARNFSTEAFVQFLQQNFPKVDMIILSRSHETTKVAKKIAEVCNNLGISLFSFDSYTATLGAAFSICPSEKEDIGYATGELALRILNDGVQADQIPLSEVRPIYKTVLNSRTMYRQCLDLDPDLLLAIKHFEFS